MPQSSLPYDFKFLKAQSHQHKKFSVIEGYDIGYRVSGSTDLLNITEVPGSTDIMSYSHVKPEFTEKN